jgi:hypothetical protein
MHVNVEEQLGGEFEANYTHFKQCNCVNDEGCTGG